MACVIIANGIMIGFQTDPEYRDWDGPCLGTDFETSSGSAVLGLDLDQPRRLDLDRDSLRPLPDR